MKSTHMVFYEPVFQEILATVGSNPPETGGILLGSRDDFVVQKFVYDTHGSSFSAGYDPAVDKLNAIIKKEWSNNRLALLGFVHSHPRGIHALSGDWGNNTGDIGYLRGIFRAIPALKQFLVPIIFSTCDGGDCTIRAYIAPSHDPTTYVEVSVYTVDKKGNKTLVTSPDQPIIKAMPNRGNEGSGKCKAKKKPLWSLEQNHPVSLKEAEASLDTSRLKGSVSPELMKNAQVVCIGVGGASGLCEDLVRSGLGKLELVDFDHVDATNLTTQGYTRDDIKKDKIDACVQHFKRINPLLEIHGTNSDFLKMKDWEIEELVRGADLLLMMTDDFHAQARGNRVALKYQLPTVFAMVYERARCAEISFLIPGVTPACHRCAVSSRYAEYENGYKNDIKQQSSTVFHTHYLNACLGLLSLAILHRDTEDLEFSDWFGRRWERNFAQIRMHPRWGNWENSLFGREFKHCQRVFSFDAVWQQIEPEAPPKYKACPDCGGTGDLTTVQIDDTTNIFRRKCA